MKPELINKSDNEIVLDSIISCISAIDCNDLFSTHLEESQSVQKHIVTKFQNRVKSALSNEVPNIDWSTEHCPSVQSRDSIDIFGKGKDFVVIIELDKTRADQIAKKFVSRMAIVQNKVIYFISLCYPGTKNMSESECVKYFDYCLNIARRLQSKYAGFIIR